MTISFSAESFGTEGYEVIAPAAPPVEPGCVLVDVDGQLEYSATPPILLPPLPGTTGQVLAKASDDVNDLEWTTPSAGVTDHGALTGLIDDDHSQYHNNTRGDLRYWPLSTDLATQAELDAIVSSLSASLALKLNSSAVSAFGLSLVDDADAAASRSTLGLVIGTNVQAFNSNLSTWAGVTPGTGIAAALGINVGSAGAPILFGGALGQPSSGDLLHCTGLPAAGVVGTAAVLGANTFTGLQTIPVIRADSSGAIQFLAESPHGQYLNVSPRGIFAIGDGAYGVSATLSVQGLDGVGIPGRLGVGDALWFGDVSLRRDAAGTLARRNSTNPQTDRLYGSYTNVNNWSRAEFAMTPTELTISAAGAGTGVDGALADKEIYLTPLGAGAVRVVGSTFHLSSSNVISSFTGGTNFLLKAWTGSSYLEGLAMVPAGVSVGKSSLATNATQGFVYVPACAGTPTGVPTGITGMSPICVDSTNNKIYFYSGGSWRDAGP